MANKETNKTKAQIFDEMLKSMNGAKTGLLSSDTGTLIAKLGDRPIKVETISTGSLVLDSILGGGIARGRVVEFYGAESSGKTSIALNAIADVQRSGGTAVFIDLESALDPRYAATLGVDIENLAVAQPDHAEQALELVQQITETGAADIIVVDSVAALVPKLELEGDAEQQSIGLIARLMSKTLRKLVGAASKTQTTIIFINQTRDAIGGFSPYGTPQTTTGGKALKFYASQRVEIKKGPPIKEGQVAVAALVKYKVVKNKIAPPLKTGESVLAWGRGIDLAAEMIEVGPNVGVITKPERSRTYIETETGEIIGTSRPSAVEKVRSDSEMYERLSRAFKKATEGGFDIVREESLESAEEETEQE